MHRTALPPVLLSVALPLLLAATTARAQPPVYAEAPARLLYGTLHSAAFSPDGSRVATAGTAGAVEWDPRTGEPLRFLPVPELPPLDSGRSYAATRLVYGPAGELLALFGDIYGCDVGGGAVVRWGRDGADGRVLPREGEEGAGAAARLERSPCHPGWAWDRLDDPEGLRAVEARLEAAGAGLADGADIWSVVRDAEGRRTLVLVVEPALAYRFPDLEASASRGVLLDPADDDPPVELVGHAGYPEAIGFVGGELWAVAENARAHRCELGRCERPALVLLPHPADHPFRLEAIAPSGRLWRGGYGEHEVVDLATGTVVGRWPDDALEGDEARRLAAALGLEAPFTLEGNQAALGLALDPERARAVDPVGAAVRLEPWDAATTAVLEAPDPAGTVVDPYAPAYAGAQSVRVSPDGTRVAAYLPLLYPYLWEWDPTAPGLWLWDPASPRPILVEPVPHQGTTVAFSADSRLLAAATGLWDARTGVRRCPFDPPATAVALGPYLALGYPDGGVELRDPGTCALLAPLPGHVDRIDELVFHPRGTWLASRSVDGQVLLWRIVEAQ